MRGAAGAPSAARTLAPREFRLFQSLIQREAGIHLVEVKRGLVEGRLSRRLRELELDFAGYYALVEADERERVLMLDCICTNETRFFREPRQFAFLQDRVFPEWEARAEARLMPRRVRVWSAGCSTGEEPYSVAMAFLARFPPQTGWTIDILATDLSTRALARAEIAVWPLAKAGDIPSPLLKAFMRRGTGAQEGRMRASAELREVVRFARLNLNAQTLPACGPFDLILCRNVLIYFEPGTKAQVLERLLDRLDARGYLFLGQAESITGLGVRAQPAGPTVYVHPRTG